MRTNQPLSIILIPCQQLVVSEEKKKIVINRDGLQFRMDYPINISKLKMCHNIFMYIVVRSDSESVFLIENVLYYLYVDIN